MPIEIRELKIRVSVDENTRKKNSMDIKEIDALKNKIIKECIDSVMAKLNHLKES
jgi:hypothetical protein